MKVHLTLITDYNGNEIDNDWWSREVLCADIEVGFPVIFSYNNNGEWKSLVTEEVISVYTHSNTKTIKTTDAVYHIAEINR